MIKTKKIYFKGKTGGEVLKVLNQLPKGTVSKFVVNAVAKQISNEIERLKSLIESWKKEIVKEEQTLSETTNLTEKEKENLKKWIEKYNRNICECQAKLVMYGHKIKNHSVPRKRLGQVKSP